VYVYRHFVSSLTFCIPDSNLRFFYTYLHFHLLESRKKPIDLNQDAQKVSTRFVLIISYLVLGPARYFVPSDLKNYSFVCYLLRESLSVRQVPKIVCMAECGRPRQKRTIRHFVLGLLFSLCSFTSISSTLRDTDQSSTPPPPPPPPPETNRQFPYISTTNLSSNSCLSDTAIYTTL